MFLSILWSENSAIVLLQELRAAVEAKLVIEEQFRQCKFSWEAEIAELRNINQELRINKKALVFCASA